MTLVINNDKTARFEVSQLVNGQNIPLVLRTKEGGVMGEAKYICWSGAYWTLTDQDVNGQYWYENENKELIDRPEPIKVSITTPNLWEGVLDDPIMQNLIHQINIKYNINLVLGDRVNN